MLEAKHLQKHALECLRLQADCMELARIAHSSNVRSYFISMAQVWGNLAVSGPGSNAGSKIFDAEISTT